MLPASPEGIAFFNSTTQGVMRPALTIVTRAGDTLRWVRNKASVTFGGATWLPHGQGGRPLLLSTRWRAPAGLSEIGWAEVVLGCNESTVLGSRPFQIAAKRGDLEGAKLLVDELYSATLEGPIVERLVPWAGKIQITPGDSHAVTLKAHSIVAEMQATMLPKTLVTGPCGNALYDPACGASRAAHTFVRAVAAGSTKNVVKLAGTDADREWEDGTLTITSGALAGEKRGIREFVSGGAVLATPLETVPAEGVTVTVTHGCDRSDGPRGCARFANLVHLRAMPHLPKES